MDIAILTAFAHIRPAVEASLLPQLADRESEPPLNRGAMVHPYAPKVGCDGLVFQSDVKGVQAEARDDWREMMAASYAPSMRVRIYSLLAVAVRYVTWTWYLLQCARP